MMRCPPFDYRAPDSIEEVVAILDGEGPRAKVIAGGTDLVPNMKRRHQNPAVLIALRKVQELRSFKNGHGVELGAALTLAALGDDHRLDPWRALRCAANSVATPHIRNAGTLGGNLCLDTRCNYYNQSQEWRQAIDFCLKKDGATCWVATASKRCVAVSSTDTAPALIALDAKVRLVSAGGEREVALADLYRNDGIDYLTRSPDEILAEVRIPEGWRSSYWKLRRRGSFDFPVLGVAVAARLAGDGTVQEARIALGAAASRPFLLDKAGEFLKGKPLSDEIIEEAGRQVASRAKPMDNTDLDLYWRKDVAAAFAGYALREVRGDDMGVMRRRIARQPL
jgi:4-hydroxybenzoyl-CoA reductase subunit beta